MSKVLKVTLIVAVCLILSACGTSSDDLVGRWNLTEVSISMGGEDITLTEGDDLWDLAGFDGSFMEFRADGTITQRMGEESQTGTWSLSGSNLTIEAGGEVETGRVRIRGNTLTFTGEDADLGGSASVVFTRN